MHPLKFLWNYIRHPRQVGAVAASSRSLVDEMLRPVDWTKAKTIVEFGPGTGVMTREILRRMGDAKLVAYEVGAEFCDQLRQLNDPRLTVKQAGAETLDVPADVIISSLPLNSLPQELNERILATAAKSLAPKGLFVQFQYTLMQQKILQRYFSVVKRRWVPLNIPPAFVFRCSPKP